eukprot:8351786-Ditylum_brightwellii.AAC.1
MSPITKGQQGGAVSYVKVPAKINSPVLYNSVTQHLQIQTGWEIIDNIDEVMTTLLMCNKLHLHQVWDIPCERGPIEDYIGDYSIGRGAKETVEENFDPNVASNLPEVNQWLQYHIR